MAYRVRSWALVVAIGSTLALAACSGGRYRPVSDWPVSIGRSYSVRGVTYTPAADPGYDVLGYASWYGSESGNRVALGERFRHLGTGTPGRPGQRVGAGGAYPPPVSITCRKAR